MNILSIDNSTRNLSVALKINDSLFEQTVKSLNYSEQIISTISMLLGKSKVDINEIDAFSLGLGPGSFTGLRISCSIIKGFCTSLKKPVIGLPSFLALACEFSFIEKKTVIITDARKNQVYASIYKQIKEKIETLVPEGLFYLNEFLQEFCDKDCVFIGESVKFKDTIKRILPGASICNNTTYPRASFLLDKTQERYLNKRFIKPDKLQPIYLHPEACQVKK